MLDKMSGAHPLLLDAAVRDWVFLPLTLAIVLMKLLTQYMHQVCEVHSQERRKGVGKRPSAI
jgi:hypothetical protein